MNKNVWKILKYMVLVILIVLLTRDQITSIVFTNFESGSIGNVIQYDDNHLRLYLKNDNGDPTLPNDWRSWWYVKIVHGDNKENKIHVDITHRGWSDFVVPFYSYDNQTWQRVDEKNVTQSDECKKGIKGCVLSFSQALHEKIVYLASFIPYTFSQLEQYLNTIAEHEAVKIEVLGYSAHYHLPIHHITITNKNSTEQIARVWIHARTHPGETPSNYVLEGLIDFLLSADPQAKILRQKLIFHIIPMHNPDGVVVGNYRSDPDSTNLEVSWFFDKNNPSELTAEAPKENRLLNQVMQSILSDKIPVKMALNIHASHGKVDERAFAFPHFGDKATRYTPEQIDLWKKQKSFIKNVYQFYDKKFQLAPYEGYATFLQEYHPETWWWYNAQNKVMALTLEATYGKAGFNHWVTDVEHRDLGASFAKSIGAYFDL